MDNTEKLNEELNEYTEANCANCYAQILDDGRLHLDDKFELADLTKIMEILGYELNNRKTLTITGRAMYCAHTEAINHKWVNP